MSVRDRPVLPRPQLLGVRSVWRWYQPIDHPQAPRCLVHVEFPAQSLSGCEGLDHTTDPIPDGFLFRRVFGMAGDVVNGDPHDIVYRLASDVERASVHL